MFDPNKRMVLSIRREDVSTKHRRVNNLLQLMTLALCCEAFYSPESGAFNMYILLGAGVVIALVLLCVNIKMLTRDISTLVWVLIIAWTLLRGDGLEPVRYALTLIIIFGISGLYVGNMRRLHIALIVLGAVLSIRNMLLNHDRATGYMLSPTIYSLQMAISIYYLLENGRRKKHDMLYCIIAFVMIVLTYSRTNILAGGGLLVYNYVKKAYLKGRKQMPIVRVIIYALLGSFAVILVSSINLEALMNIRLNAQDSTNTRMYWIIKIWQSVCKKPAAFLVGMGGGFATGQLSDITYVPLHQDLMLFACEYGIVYFLMLFSQMNKKYRFDLVEWALVIVGSFHNLFLSSVTVLLFFTTVRSLYIERIRRKTVEGAVERK